MHLAHGVPLIMLGVWAAMDDWDWILPDAVFDGERLVQGLAIGTANGIVQAVKKRDGRRIDGVISTGFVDLQVNGGGGVLFNADPTPDGIAKIATAHRQFGTTQIIPTVITDTPEVLGRAVDASIAAKEMPGILGLHVEGPHIALAKRGTHAAEFVRPMDAETINLMRRLRDADVPVMMTLAPESTTPSQIAELTEMGVVVSIGHSDASADQVRTALDAGARSFTHLFNAMSQMQGREPGVVGAAINSDVYVGVIVDGVHVNDDMVAMAIRARPEPDRMFLVSDAMPTVGGSDEFELYGNQITLKDGRLINQEGALAGAHLTMAGAVHRCVTQLGLSLEEALRMAITVPLAVMKVKPRPFVGTPINDLIEIKDSGIRAFTGK